jgi:hypothetical protein
MQIEREGRDAERKGEGGGRDAEKREGERCIKKGG